MIKTNETKKVNNEISIKEVQSLYFNSDAIQESGIILRRLDYAGKRNYFTVTEENQLDKMYTSTTTFTKAVLPTSPYLLDWMKNKSKEEQDFILKSSSTYGTLMDILYSQLIISGTVENIAEQTIEFTKSENLQTINHNKWIEQLKKDCLSFAQFVKDYDVKPLLVSCPLKSERYQLAGTLDLLCSMNEKIPTQTDIKKGVEIKRIVAIVDYKAKIGDFSLKSDRSSFYESECLQVLIYRYLLKENFEDYSNVSLCNFSPSNWRTNPGYNFKRWDNTKVLEGMEMKLVNYWSNFRIDNASNERSVMEIEDKITLENFNDEFRTIPLTDYINKNLQEAIL